MSTPAGPWMPDDQLAKLVAAAAAETDGHGGYRYTYSDALHAVYALASETDTLLTPEQEQAVPAMFRAVRAAQHPAGGGVS